MKRRGLVRLISILPAVGAIIALIQVVICFFSIKKWNENDDHQQSEKINA